MLYKAGVAPRDTLCCLNKHWAGAIADTVQQLHLGVPAEATGAALLQHVSRLASRFRGVRLLSLVSHAPQGGFTIQPVLQMLPFAREPGPILRGWGLRSFSWTLDGDEASAGCCEAVDVLLPLQRRSITVRSALQIISSNDKDFYRTIASSCCA